MAKGGSTPVGGRDEWSAVRVSQLVQDLESFRTFVGDARGANDEPLVDRATEYGKDTVRQFGAVIVVAKRVRDGLQRRERNDQILSGMRHEHRFRRP